MMAFRDNRYGKRQIVVLSRHFETVWRHKWRKLGRLDNKVASERLLRTAVDQPFLDSSELYSASG